MPVPLHYLGREQTYLKHLFLRNYLERFAFKVGSAFPEIWYVDGFSGPWNQKDPSYEDTSFFIAHKALSKAINGLNAIGKSLLVKCVFIEQNPKAYKILAGVANKLGNDPKIVVEPLPGDFEENLNGIVTHGLKPHTFAFVFVDPKGWTGFGMKKMQPILKRRGSEVLINFMYDFINRFIDPENSDVEESFNQLFGDDSWKRVIKPGLSGEGREAAIIDHYCTCLKRAVGFKHVTFTRVFKPNQERTYFYLIFGTHDIEGIRVFRKVEEIFASEQEEIRDEKINPTMTLFPLGTRSFNKYRDSQIEKAKQALINLLKGNCSAPYEEIESKLLELPFVWEKDLQGMLKELRDVSQSITVQGWKPKQRKFQKGHVFIWKGN